MTERPKTTERVGRYQLMTRIATGGMAEIFLAKEIGLAGLERLVVIKRILPHLLDDPAFVDMFLREARIIARLNHPNVVQIHELGEDNGSYFIALEYIHGVTLREIQTLTRKGKLALPLEVALSIVIEACRGAHAAHELADPEGKPLGLVHRDISPHNLMITEDGHVKLLDFGVAKASEGLEATASGNLKGKYAYMSPEQCLHRPLDRRSDVFALGILLWELLAGRRLFNQKTEIEILHAIVHGGPVHFEQVNVSVPPAVEAVVHGALTVDRDDRYPSAEAFRRAIHDLARELDLELGSDGIGAYVRNLAGDYLTERAEIVTRAKTQSLNTQDAARLTRASVSKSEHIEDDAPTVSARPRVFEEEDADDEVEASDTVVSTELPIAVDEPDKPAKLDTRPFLLGAVGLVLIIGAGVYAAMGGSGTRETQADDYVPDGPPLAIAWAPTVDVEILRSELEPIRRHIELEIDRPIEVVFAADYGDLAEKVVSGEVPFGVFPPLLYVRTSTANPETLELVAVKEFDGAQSSDGYLLVRHDAAVASLADLAGKRMCFTDENSTTGHFLPSAFIRQAGHDPDTFFSKIHWSGGHLQVMRDLIADECDAAATYNGAFLTADSYDIPTGRLRVLAITGNIPQDVVVAGPAATDEERAAITKHLLALTPDLVGAESRIGDNQRITGFGEVSEDTFANLRAAFDAAPEP